MAASVRLKTTNYRGPSLHPTARDTRQAHSSALASPPSAPSELSPFRNMDEEDVNRPPDSSDEDESQQPSTTDDAAHPEPQRPSPPLKRKRAEPTVPARQSKRKPKLKDRGDLLPPEPAKIEQPNPSSQADLFGMPIMASQSQSQRQKLSQKYTSRKKEAFMPIAPVAQRMDPSKEPRSFEIREALVEKPANTARPELDMGKAAAKREQKAKPDFKTFMEGSQVHSSASAATSDVQVMELTSSPNVSRVQRSLSVSSFTSVSSQEGEADTKPVLNMFEDTSTVPCPVCKERIDRTLVSSSEKNLRSLSLRQQQDICHRHKLSEAKTTASNHGYPNIDWDHVENIRIPAQLDHLRRVLRKEAPSYYQQQLDAQIESSKGKPKALRTYLHTGILDIAKPGYYGPKGEKVMVHVVTTALSSDLRQASKTDKGLRAAGVGPYVTAVLVPELTMRLVMEDMNVHGQEKAREILDESTEVGRLLQPDDDRVELYDEV